MATSYVSKLRWVAAFALCLNAFDASAQSTAKDASDGTIQSNRDLAASLAWQDEQDFEFAQRGFIAKPESTVIRDASGNLVWNMDQFAYQALDAPAPDNVNPSLWRQARLNSQHGLFKVTDRIYQVRGYDLSNISIIEGDTGYIVIDPLLTAEVAAAAMELVYEHLPRKPVVVRACSRLLRMASSVDSLTAWNKGDNAGSSNRSADAVRAVENVMT